MLQNGDERFSMLFFFENNRVLLERFFSEYIIGTHIKGDGLYYKYANGWGTYYIKDGTVHLSIRTQLHNNSFFPFPLYIHPDVHYKCQIIGDSLINFREVAPWPKSVEYKDHTAAEAERYDGRFIVSEIYSQIDPSKAWMFKRVKK